MNHPETVAVEIIYTQPRLGTLPRRSPARTVAALWTKIHELARAGSSCAGQAH